uniref:Putative kazal protease inhibitor-like protein n=1 Tax=Rhipicephalus microplus TaxID=6941 RepID=A0A6G5A7D9_RHIMP
MATTKTLLPYLILFAILVLNGNCRPQNTHANVTLRERSRSDYEYCLKQVSTEYKVSSSIIFPNGYIWLMT